MTNADQVCWRKHAKQSAVTLCGATWMVVSGAVFSQTEPSTATPSMTRPQAGAIKFALPAEPLAETLRAISQQSGLSVRFKPNDLAGIQAPAIHGRYTPDAALQMAVAGSKATMSSAPGGGWVVFIPTKLDTVTVTANVDEAETSFQATRSDTTSRSGTDLMDVPQSMTIITSAVLQSQQALEVGDVLQDVSGVQTTAQTQGPATLNIRGLQVSTLSNGLTNTFATNTNIAGVERIEVLQGPEAILSGGDSLGGAVNIVTKKPSAKPIADVTLQYGSFGDKTVSTDLSDALADNGKLSGRVIASWTRATTSDAGFDGRRENYLMPAVRWKDDKTDFTVGASYDDERDPLGRYTFAPLDRIVQIPTMVLGNRDNGNEVKTRSIFYNLEHKFAPWLTVVSNFSRDLVSDDLNIWLGLFPADIPSMTVGYSPSHNTSRYGTTSTDNYLRFTFRTGPFQHVLSTGVNTTGLNYTTYEYSLPGYTYVPVLSPQQFDFPYLNRNPSTQASDDQIATRQFGVYAQDQITFGNFHVLLNMRRTEYQTLPSNVYYIQSNFDSYSPKQEIFKSTPGAGIVYDVTPNVSVYGEYSEGFMPQFSATTPLCTGGFNTPPQSSRNAEVGVKLSSPDGQFSLTSAAYNLNLTNVTLYNQALNCSDLIAGQRTRGVEMDAQGQLAKGWNVIANLTHSNYFNTGSTGLLIPGEYENHVSLWTTYDFPAGPLHGLGVGGGITAYGRSYTNIFPGSPLEPGGARVDLSASYKWQKQWSFILGVKNVFNRTLYGVATTPFYIPVNPGRTVMFTAKYSFF